MYSMLLVMMLMALELGGCCAVQLLCRWHGWHVLLNVQLHTTHTHSSLGMSGEKW
jgi:hypothetical protein